MAPFWRPRVVSHLVVVEGTLEVGPGGIDRHPFQAEATLAIGAVGTTLLETGTGPRAPMPIEVGMTVSLQDNGDLSITVVIALGDDTWLDTRVPVSEAVWTTVAPRGVPTTFGAAALTSRGIPVAIHAELTNTRVRGRRAAVNRAAGNRKGPGPTGPDPF